MPWDKSYSRTFVDLLAVCAAAEVVVPLGTSPPTYTIVNDAGLSSQAAALLGKEFVARLDSTSGRNFHPSDQVEDDCVRPVGRCGPYVANRFCATTLEAPDYHGSSIDYPGGRPPVTAAGYQSVLAEVIASAARLMEDVAAQATRNAAIDPTSTAQCAADLVAARASYVSTLQGRYPDRGFA